MRKWRILALGGLATMVFLMAADLVFAQAGRPAASGGPGRSASSRLHDEHARDDRMLGTLTFKAVENGFDIDIDKNPMNPFSVRPYLNGKKIKGDQCRGECVGTLKLIVNRMVHGQRFVENCSAPTAFPAVARILIPPSGGVTCYFETTHIVTNVTIREVSSEPLTDWEKQLSAKDFIKVGNCLDDHEQGSQGFAGCLQKAGVTTPTHVASKN